MVVSKVSLSLLQLRTEDACEADREDSMRRRSSASLDSRSSASGIVTSAPLAAAEQQASQAWCGIPRWVRDWRTWATVFVACGVVALGLWRLLFNESVKQHHFRLEVEGVAQQYQIALRGQLHSSISSLRALSALLQVDDQNLTMNNFESIAGLLMETLHGITNLQLAPFGTVQKIHPLVTPELDNRGAIGHALLLDPGRKAGALAAIESQSVVMVGPLTLLQGGLAVIARYAVFTPFAHEHLPDESWSREGVTYTRICSDAMQRVQEECSFPGPVENGTQTYFWGFATLLTLIPDLLRPLALEKLEEQRALSTTVSFHFQLRDMTPHSSIESAHGIFAHSSVAGPEVLLDNPVSMNISLPELGVDWELSLAPRGGWPTVASDFWIQLVLLLLATGLTSAAAGFMVIGNVRGAYQRLQRLEDYRACRRAAVVGGSVDDLDRVRFPMCIMAISDFEQLGRLIPHEEARKLGMLTFLDTAAAMKAFTKHTVFISHQWAGFAHPDTSGSQYSSMVQACKALSQTLGHNVQWVWVDYFSIPQANPDQQQAAIDTLAVYAAHSSIFVAVAPPCKHVELGVHLDAKSYSWRAWCRLEQLAYLSANSHLPSMPAFLCGSQGLQPLFHESTDASSSGSSPWQAALEVMNGDFSCCARGHPNEMPCDKARIVGVMLGTLWRLKCAARDRTRKASRVDELLELIEKDSERYFPSMLRYSWTNDLGEVFHEDRELFGDTMAVLQELFQSTRTACSRSSSSLDVAGLSRSSSRLDVVGQSRSSSRLDMDGLTGSHDDLETN